MHIYLFDVRYSRTSILDSSMQFHIYFVCMHVVYVRVAPGEVSNDHIIEAPTNELPTPLSNSSDRRSSRDIGVQAFSLEIEEEKKKLIDDKNEQHPPAKTSETKRRDYHKCKQNETSKCIFDAHQIEFIF